MQISFGDINGITDAMTAWLYLFVPQALAAILILVFGLTAAHFLSKGFVRMLGASTRIDLSIRQVLGSALRYGLILIVFVAALTQLGVPSASLLAVLGASGLAIGLALQGTLTNISAGVMLLWLRPFRVGDYIVVANQGIAGTVREMGLFNCVLQTRDGVRLFAPNAQVWNFSIANFRSNKRRLVEAQVVVPADTAPGPILEALKKAVEGTQATSANTAVDVYVEGVSGDGYSIIVRHWVPQAKLWQAVRSLYDVLDAGLKNDGIELSAPLRMTRRFPEPGTESSYAD